jgi:uracil-DNA glycosylase family 4
MAGEYVGGYGAANAKLLIIGEAPAKQEVIQGRPFVGSSGKELDEMLRNGGMNRNEVYTTNVFKYRCPGDDIENASLTGHSIEEGIAELWREIDTIKPNCILALGNLALSTLTGKEGITKWRGSILSSIHGNYKVVSSIHPASLFKRTTIYQQKAYIQADISRAIKESQRPDLDLPNRTLGIIRSSYELYNFLDAYKHLDKVMVDIEVIKCIPTCIGLAFNKNHAVSVPTIPLSHLKGSILMTDSERREIWRMLARFLENPKLKICGQNFKFDHSKLLNPMRIRIKDEQVYFDTMLAQHVLNPEFPKKLEFISSIYTREPFYKDEGREYNPKKDSLDRHYLYNAKDCVVQYECMEEQLKELEERELKDFFFDFIMPQHGLYRRMEERGLRIDYEKRQELFSRYTDLEIKYQTELNEIAGFHVNVASNTKDVPLFVFTTLGMPKRENVSEETLVALLANHGKKPEQVKGLNLIIDLRRIRNAKSKLSVQMDYDGKLRAGYRIGGTETGRSSTAILKAPVRPHKIGLSFHSITKHGELGKDIRAMIVPSPGYIFMNADLSQAEARVVAILANDEEMLELFEKTDIHRVTACWIFGCKFEDVTQDQRFMGKTLRHAGNYDMQKHTHMLEVNTSARRFGIDVNISEWRAGKNLEIFHQRSPKIRGIFHSEIVKKLEESRTLRNPNGRTRVFFERWGHDLFKEAYATIPQGTVKDHLTSAMYRIEKEIPNIRFLLESHDAFLTEIPDNPESIKFHAELFLRELERPIDFSSCSLPRGKLIIPGEVELGYNYKDLRKWKREQCPTSTTL